MCGGQLWLLAGLPPEAVVEAVVLVGVGVVGVLVNLVLVTATQGLHQCSLMCDAVWGCCFPHFAPEHHLLLQKVHPAAVSGLPLLTCAPAILRVHPHHHAVAWQVQGLQEAPQLPLLQQACGWQ